MKIQRLEDIEKLVMEREHVTIQDLCSIFKVSINTIRRDVDTLVKRGSIEKVYGGVRAKKTSTLISFEQRDTMQHEQKKAIGKLASSLIEPNDIIFIDSGTTTSQIMPYLDPNITCTIFTNNFDVIHACTQMPNVRLFVIGSLYQGNTRSFVNVDGDPHGHRFNINKAFMAATGVTTASGLTNSNPLEYEIKHSICDKAREIILLVDGSKFGKSTLLTYWPLDGVSTLITSDDVPEEYVEYCTEHDIKLLTV
ncbi:DeoR/GlpR family DNA-binding transcription regulator [Paenibacillus azoreducens]|uniref:HTH-type transcriptional regulator IolR n=1 Tax=Paenibacillus azoreducens TaxID=116718 RepID=A0A920CQT1_9BACL|nr:DeoR/GlpR family DNA-binding transcription regulator [Paenibacillus azoreducens]GIO45612.1 HTH-type transcriptional regulator IolR [Paenibacillus azoreducens]